MFVVLSSAKGGKMRIANMFLVAALSAMLSIAAAAQQWSKTLDLNFTLTQNSYSNSWTGGEAGSAS